MKDIPRSKPMIYLDNAATSIDKEERVADAIYHVLMDKSYANPSRSSHKLSINALRKVLEIRENIGEFFDFHDPSRVILTPNITYALNYIIKSLFKENDHIITSLSEHNSVLRPLYDYRNHGGKVSFIGIDDNFNLRLDEIEPLINNSTRAVIITGASNISGKVTDLKKIHSICKKHGLSLIIDGAQLAGCVPFSMKDFDNTIFAFTGHKGLHGPQGSGGFIVNGNFDFKQVFSGGSGFSSFLESQPNNLPDLFEVGTMNLPSFVGLSESVKFLKDNPPYQRLDYLTRYMYKKLKENDRLEFYTKLEETNAPIVSFNIKGYDADTVGYILDDKYDICVRTGAHCAPLFHKRFKTEKRSIVRASLSTYTTIEEIDKFVEAIDQISQK